MQLQANGGTTYRLKSTDEGTFLQFMDADGHWRFVPRPAYTVVTGKFIESDTCPRCFGIEKPLSWATMYEHMFRGVDNATRDQLIRFTLKYPEISTFFEEIHKNRLEYLECRIN